MRHLSKILLCCTMAFCAGQVYAQEAFVDESTVAVFGKACEPVRENETRAGSRVRATDKAGFHAVENVPQLSDKRSQLSQHDFNVLVYHLVDNYLEDMAVRTVNQNDKELCVEVTGYLTIDNIAKAENAVAEQKQGLAADEAENNQGDEFLELETSAENLAEAVTAMPPKPQPKIHKDIAFDKQADDVDDTNKTIVFIDKTKFYNGTDSNGFFATMEQVLAENALIKVASEPEGANYTLRTNVLRAKVDPINQQTSRMQIVIQFELEDLATKKVITEHQNRFILFESIDDEQQTATALMKKLLRRGCTRLMPKIKTPDEIAASQPSAVITPPESR